MNIFPDFQTVWIARGCYLYIPFVFMTLVNDIVKKRLVVNTFSKPLLLYWVLAVVSTVLNLPIRNLPTTVHHLSNLIMMTYIIFTIPFIYGKEETEKIIVSAMKMFICSVLAINILSLIALVVIKCGLFPKITDWARTQAAFRQIMSDGTSLRIKISLFYRRATTAANYVTAASIFTMYLAEKKAVSKYLTIGLFLTSIILLPFFGSRLGLICYVLIFVYLAWRLLYLKKGRRTAFTVTALLLIAGAAAVCLWQAPKLAEMISIYGLNEGIVKFTSHRVLLLDGTIDGFKERPLLGWGFTQPVSTALSDGSGMNAHNLILNLVQWTGLAGLFVFLYFAVKAVKTLRNNFKEIVSGPVFWLYAFMVHSLIWSMGQIGIIGVQNDKEGLFWLVLGYLLFLGEAATSMNDRNENGSVS